MFTEEGWADRNETMSLEKSKDCAGPVIGGSMGNELSFTVFGIPVPQGSTRAFIPKGWKRPIITAANAKTKPWRQEIAGVALAEMAKAGMEMQQGALLIACDFYFERPKSSPKRITDKTTKPDIDKLIRSVLDSLTGIVFKDDAQIVRCMATKGFGNPARVEICVKA